MSKTVNVAVVGATGAVGRTMLDVLQQRNFPCGEVFALASERSVGEKIDFCGRQLRVGLLDDFDFSQAHVALFSAGAEISRAHAHRATRTGCVVIDNTSYFRNEEDIPLVVPEVNPEALADVAESGIIANPNCSTIQMVVALAPIHRAAGIERINVATYQSVSGAGQAGIDELSSQTMSLLNFRPIETHKFSQQIAFNVLPHIDAFQDNGYTREEMKMVWETRKILSDRSMQINPTCVRVPVFYGHALAVHLETREKLPLKTVRTLLQKAPGVELLDDVSSLTLPTPAVHAAGNDAVYVGRVREDISHPRGLCLWIVSDNIRKGAALNSVQIAEKLLKTLDI